MVTNIMKERYSASMDTKNNCSDAVNGSNYQVLRVDTRWNKKRVPKIYNACSSQQTTNQRIRPVRFIHPNNILFVSIQLIILFAHVSGQSNQLQSEQPTLNSIDPIILVASIVASASAVVLCLALFLAWKKGQERFQRQMEEMHMTQETSKEFHTPERTPRTTDDESQYLPSPSELDNRSMMSLSNVDSKSYRHGGDGASVVSMESYSFSLDGYAPSIANSSVAYGY